jgi:hypothetical protein
VTYLSKAINVLKEDGISGVIRQGIPFVYDQHLLPLLPRVYANYNRVQVKSAKIFDSVIPWREKDKPNYESGLVSGIDEYVDSGDSVVIIGGGWGVTTVKAAMNVGEEGSLTVYEGSKKELNHVLDTINKNGVQDRVDPIHAVVGPEISLRGEARGAEQVSPEEIPSCDVLELDCEGAEISILESLKIQPETILVESHGMHGAPTSEVENLLNQMSYSVKSKRIADKGVAEQCERDDIYVLAAVREGSSN